MPDRFTVNACLPSSLIFIELDFLAVRRFILTTFIEENVNGTPYVRFLRHRNRNRQQRKLLWTVLFLNAILRGGAV